MDQEKRNPQVADFSIGSMELDGLLSDVGQNLPRWIASIKTKKILFGFDGVLDEIYSVVFKRHSVQDYELVHSIADWGEIIKNAAGSATNFEIIEKKRSTGGFVANTAGSLLAIAAPLEHVTLVGDFGTGEIAPPFKDTFVTKYNCKLISIGTPSYTHAYEFDDGKLMMTSFASVLALDVASLVAKVPEEELIRLIDGTALFGLGYWSIAPGMTSIFRFFATQIFPAAREPLNLLLDLASLRKRSEGDIRDMATVINQFPEHVRVTLSLNDKEAMQLYEALSGRKVADDYREAEISLENKELFLFLIEAIYKHLFRCHVIVHTPRFALSIRGNTNEAGRRQVDIVPNAYTKHASFTVAAGDAFNGGVALGLLAGCTPREMLMIGNATASQFIRTGQRCTMEQALCLLRNYQKYLKDDHPEVV